MIYSLFQLRLVMLRFLVMKWVIIVDLNNFKINANFQLDIIDLKNAKRFKQKQANNQGLQHDIQQDGRISAWQKMKKKKKKKKK